MKILADDFDGFWAAYPRKDAKAQAKRTWEKLRLTAPALENLAFHLEYMKKTQWAKRDRDFIPHASTYLRSEDWSEERCEAIADEWEEDQRAQREASLGAPPRREDWLVRE